MEQEPRIPLPTRMTEDGWQRYDAVPRAGPAVFIAKEALLDAGVISGHWLDPCDTAEVVSARIDLVTGQLGELGGYAIIDQVGLGPDMLAEDLTPAELAFEARARTSGVRP